MTASVDVLKDLAAGGGPSQALLMLGYSGWGPGQLEEEIIRNGWLIADALFSIVFERPAEDKWDLAVRSLGIDPSLLSSTGGSA